MYAVEGTAGAGIGTVGAATVDGIAGEFTVDGAAVNDVAEATVIEVVTGSHAYVLELLP